MHISGTTAESGRENATQSEVGMLHNEFAHLHVWSRWQQWPRAERENATQSEVGVLHNESANLHVWSRWQQWPRAGVGMLPRARWATFNESGYLHICIFGPGGGSGPEQARECSSERGGGGGAISASGFSFRMAVVETCIRHTLGSALGFR